MKYSLLIYCTLLFLVALTATRVAGRSSPPVLQGYVLDGGSGAPLAHANVYLLSAHKGTVTDPNGFFELSVPALVLPDTLVIKYIGYQEYHISVVNYINKSIIRLHPEILQSDKSIVIYAEKINLARQELPHLVFTLDPERIQQYSGSEISNLFKSDPAVHIEGNDLQGRMVEIRGCDPDEVNVYVDGILINSAGFNNAADLSVISTTNIQRLEIFKGSNLILLGSGAFGGVINIITHKKMESEYGLQLKYGSAASKYISAEINQPLHKRLLLTYNGNWGYFVPRIEYFDSERYGVKTRAKDIVTYKHNHNLSLNYFAEHGQYSGKLLGYFLDYHKPLWKYRSNAINAAASYQGDILQGRDFEFSTQYMLTNDRTERESTTNVIYISRMLSRRLYLRLSKNYDLFSANSSPFTLQLVSEYLHDELQVERSAKTLLNSNKFYQAALYDNRASLGGILSLGENLNDSQSASWRMYAGMRGDFLATGKNYKESSFGFQIKMTHSEWTFTPYLSYGENIKFPSLLENAYQADILDLSLAGSRLDSMRLKPETNNSAESGITITYQPLNFLFAEQNISLAVFLNHTANKMLRRPLENTIVQTQLGVNTTKGVEISIQWNKIFSAWNLSFAFEQLDIENPLIYAFKPDKNFSLQLEYNSPAGFYGGLTVFYEGKSLAWDYNSSNQFVTQSISPFSDLDLLLGYRFNLQKLNLQIQVDGFNLLDNAGYKYYYLKKRFLQIGLHIH
jgi:outer membrane cobalamin receptor